MLYTHGGAYVYGSPSTHEVIISRLAEKSGVAVFAYDYRLAPEHPFPAALEVAVTAFDYLLQQGFGPRDIVLCGDSAGRRPDAGAGPAAAGPGPGAARPPWR